jgi:phosphoglycerate dehydrogenase-like enzyme
MGDAAAPQNEYVICLLPFPEDSKLLDQIRKEHPNVEFEYHFIQFNSTWDNGSHEVTEESWKKVTIIVTLRTLPPNIHICKNLKLVHLFSAGANQFFDTPLWKETDILISNSSGVHGPTIAEWVVMQLLSHSHKQKLLYELQRKKEWGNHQDIGFVKDMVGQRLGVLGYGAIGRQTARVAKALGMDVIAYTAGPRNTPESKKDYTYTVPGTGDPDGLIPSAWYSGLSKSSLHEFLSQSIDILLISVPLTPETTHFLASPEFKILAKNHAFIINIARGKVVNQEDMIESLKSGELRGAALDVTDPEPLPKESELWELENVSVTPHISGLGTLYAQRSFEILEANLTAFERGRGLTNLVDRRKGY